MNLDEMIVGLEKKVVWTSEHRAKPEVQLGSTSTETRFSSGGITNGVLGFVPEGPPNMTVRDHYACAIIQGMLAAKNYRSPEECFAIADDMMAARTMTINRNRDELNFGYQTTPSPDTKPPAPHDPLAPVDYK